MKVSRITKEMKPVGHVGLRRWIKYVARNPALVTRVKAANKYLHASRTK